MLIAFFNTHMHKMGHQGPKHYIFGDHFYSEKMPESLGSMYSSILMLENIHAIIILLEVGRIHKKL